MSGARRWLTAAAAAAALALTSACAAGAPAATVANGDRRDLTIAVFNGWDEGIAASLLWQELLEGEGYNVTLRYADVAAVFAGLAGGDYDVTLDSWLPVLHAPYFERFGAQIEDLGAWYPNGQIALAVNEDAPITSIAELAEHSADFDHRIVGIEPGASYMNTVRDVLMPTYGLEDMTLVTSSTPAMLAELRTALNAGENIVVTLWRPHWAYDAFPVRNLEDPENTLGPAEGVHAVGSARFAEHYPTLAGWIRDFEMSDEQLSSLENVLFNPPGGGDVDQRAVVREWVADNREYAEGLTG